VALVTRDRVTWRPGDAAACGRREQESRKARRAGPSDRADAVRAARAAPGTCNRTHRRRRSDRAPASAAPPPGPEGPGLGWKGDRGTRATPSLRRHRGGPPGQPLAVRRAGVAASGTARWGGRQVHPPARTPSAPPGPHRARAGVNIGAAGPTVHPPPQHHLPGRRARDSGGKGDRGTRATPSLRRHRGGAHQQPLAVRRAGVAASGTVPTAEAGGDVRPIAAPRRPGHSRRAPFDA